MFIDVPVLDKSGKRESYLLNVNNINYMRKWMGAKGEIQSVVYFTATEKYIIVDMQRDSLAEKIKQLKKEV